MLKIYNTLSREKEEFVPLHGKRVSMFVCGLSPYDLTHVGHAKTYINYDIIARYLRFKGYGVFYVQNVTDVEDRIINRAIELGVETKDLVQKHFKGYLEDMEALNVKSVNLYAWATNYLPEIFDQIKVLIEKGYAYEADGNVYFEVKKFKDFGALSNIDVDEHTESLVHSAQLETDENKRHPADFALWKKWKEGEPWWDSPWGKGRPGWHIEDTAIAITHFGPQYDIHGGAIELMFPHHEAEIAQAEVYTGKKPYVKYWPHTGVLNVEGKKMSKSLGNFMTVRDALKLCNPQVLRFFFVNVHYRSPFDFTQEQLVEAGKSYERLLETIRNLREALKMEAPGNEATTKTLENILDTTKKKFFDSMDDDFNTREALGALFEFSREVNRILSEGSVGKEALEQALGLFNNASEILGLFQNIPERITGIKTFTVDAILVEDDSISGTISGTSTVKGELTVDKKVLPGDDEKTDKLISLIIEILKSIRKEGDFITLGNFISFIIGLREDARKRRDFEMSDRIRAKLSEIGIVLEDTKDGIRWKKGGI